MKNILNKIYFHPFFIITLFIFILIGKFKFISYFMIIIIFHELGHILMSLYYKWNVEKIILLPFGGFVKYKKYVNTPLIEEFMVAISGVVFQIIFFLLVKSFIDYKYFKFINYFIIVFNLLPIYPLDGSKILNVILNKVSNYRTSINFSIISSFFLIINLFIFFININKLISFTLVFLFKEVFNFFKNKELLFNKFLLERYLNDFKFKRTKIVKNYKKMKLDYEHILLLNKKYVKEQTFLSKMFDNFQVKCNKSENKV